MSAELLRRAAALMRERAEAATPGPWEEWAVKPTEGDTYNAVGHEETERVICSLPREPQGSMDAEHIASWHPAVALAVADWLDAEAESHRADLVGPFPSTCCRMGQALTVARAYLGEANDE